MDQYSDAIQTTLQSIKQLFMIHYKTNKDLEKIITTQQEQIEKLEKTNNTHEEIISNLTTSIRSCKNYYRSRYETCDCDRELCMFCEWRREDEAFRLEMETRDSNKRKFEQMKIDIEESESNLQKLLHKTDNQSKWSKHNRYSDIQEKRNKKSI